MNKIIFASLAAALTGLMGSPTSAEARHNNNNEAVAAVGGFIGGLIVGASIHNHTPPPPPHVGVVVSSGRSHGPGHWEWVTVRTWVPGHWAYVEGRRGRTTRVWVSGYYETHRDRVWVSRRGHDRRECR